MIASLLLSKDTALLIEEVEVFQHPKAMQKIAKHLVKLAEKNNVQLFITTHSYFDALRYFESAYTDRNKDKEFRTFLVEKDNGRVKVNKTNIQNIIEGLGR